MPALPSNPSHRSRQWLLLIVACFVVVFQLGCDSTEPDEVELAIGSMSVQLTAVSGLGLGTPPITITVPGNGSSKFASDTLSLMQSTTYEGFVTVFQPDGERANEAFVDDPEEVQVFYVNRVGGLGTEVTDREEDYGSNDFGENLPVGLKIDVWTLAGSAGDRGSVEVQIVSFPPRTKNGRTDNGGTNLALFEIPVRIVRAPGPSPLSSPISHATVTLVPRPSPRDTLTRVASAVNLDGLQLGATVADTLRARTGVSYAGSIQLFNEMGTVDVTGSIISESEYYLVEYDIFNIPPGFGTYTPALDKDGLPHGLTFDVSYPIGSTIFDKGSIRVYQFDPNRGDDKSEMRGELIVDYELEFRYGTFQ